MTKTIMGLSVSISVRRIPVSSGSSARIGGQQGTDCMPSMLKGVRVEIIANDQGHRIIPS